MLDKSYANAARAASHDVGMLEIARIAFPLLKSKAEWDEGAVPSSLEPAQQDIEWAQHLVVIYPLWLGGMPAVLNILGFAGVAPIRETLIGSIESMKPAPAQLARQIYPDGQRRELGACGSHAAENAHVGA